MDFNRAHQSTSTSTREAAGDTQEPNSLTKLDPDIVLFSATYALWMYHTIHSIVSQSLTSKVPTGLAQ
eukprot:1269455-Rhodomonas_salina.4